jgi:hypothetical protein
LRLHQDFKFAVVGRLGRGEPWNITDAQIIETVARLDGCSIAAVRATSVAERSARRLHGATGSSRSPKPIAGSSRRATVAKS